MKDITASFQIIGGVPALVTREPINEADAKTLKAWFETVRESGTAFIGTELGIARHNDPWYARGPGAAAFERAEFTTTPETDERHGVTVTVGGEFSDITRDGFVIHVDDKVARGLVHAIGHMMKAHHDALPLIMLASVLDGEAGNSLREFNGLAKLGAALVAQGVENVEVDGVPLIKSGKVSDEFVS